MSEVNHEMIHAAIARREVWVAVSGLRRRAKLIAWEPHRSGRRLKGKARVEFTSGNRATVNTSTIELVEETADGS